MKYLQLTITIALLSFANPVPVDYKQAFGTDYDWAIKWLQKNKGVFEKYAVQFHIPSKELKAIIFPELIRYNTVYDVIEINSLKYLYVSEGRDYADFSVGYFQMKPSFAEMVERDAANLPDTAFLRISGFDSLINVSDNETTRKERVRRITNIEHQIIYLCAFYKICTVQFADKFFASDKKKIKFYATCYNAGYRRSYEKIITLQDKKYFHTGKIRSGTLYNYADICCYYFEKE